MFNLLDSIFKFCMMGFAENVNITPGSGDVIGADDISSVKYQRVKLIVGADGVNDGDIASGNPLPVDVISALPAGTNAIGKLAANSGVDIGDVDATCTNAGTFVVQEDGAALTALQLMDDWDATHDSAIGTDGAVVMAEAIATDGTAAGTDVAEADATRVKAGLDGVLLVNQTHPYHWSASADYAAAQTNATVKAAAGEGLSLYITDVIVSNGATAGNITLLDGSGGTVLLELYPAINGGLTHSFRTPIKLTANTLLAITSTTVTTHSITVSGYIGA